MSVDNSQSRPDLAGFRPMSSKRLRRWSPLHWLIAGTLALPSCAAASPQSKRGDTRSGQVYVATDSLHDVINHARTDLTGLDEFYDHAPTLSTLSRRETMVNTWLEFLATLNYSQLQLQAKVDYQLLRSHLKFEIEAMKLARARLGEMEPLIRDLAPILTLEEERRHLQTLDVQATALAFDRAGASVEGLVKRVVSNAKKSSDRPADAIVVSPIVAARAARHLEHVRKDAARLASHFTNYDPQGAWWLRTPSARLDSALEAYIKHLRHEVAEQRGTPEDPLIGDPIGAQALQAEISREMLAYSPQELLALGESQLKWCEDELKKAARELGQSDWRKALESVKDRHVAPGQQAALVAQQASAAIDFLDRHELVTIPDLARELWRLEMSTAERQRYLPFASYDYQYMSVGYPTDAMSHEQKMMSMRANNVHFSRNVTPHELIPGHHLQHFMADRYNSHRKWFYTPFLVEGWAVHWEILFWEMGYPQTPQDKIGVLFWRMHRAMRIILSLKYHLGEMSAEEMVAFLVAHGHEVDSATSEVRRYIDSSGEYGPLYQVGYLAGALQIQSLYKELVGPKKWTARAFHDTVLQQGPIPNVLIRAILLREDIPLAGPRPWRFAEPWLGPGGAK
jgi:uncharacterized protein (DUF885 family)